MADSPIAGFHTDRKTARYIARRIALIIPTIFVASIIIFLILRVLPGDVVLVILSGAPHTPEVREALRNELGLNDPLPAQYAGWVWNMVNGNLGGVSLETREPISAIINDQLPVTILLTLYSMTVSIIISLPLGVAAAVYQNRWQDKLIRLFSLGGLSLPVVWTALLVIASLLIVFRWSPPVIYTNLREDSINHMQIMIWPVLLLAWEYGSHIVRITRSNMIETLHKDYISAARAKGLHERSVVFRYGLKNSMVPVITLVGLQMGTLLSGAIVLETIFGLPGIGRSLVSAAISRDLPVVQSVVMIIVLFYFLINLAVDVLYSVIDPRIKTEV